MDTSATYREIVKQVILKYAKLRPSHGNIRLDAVFDETRERYALMQVGWDRGKRVRGNLIYLTIQDGKVYLEYDGMEMGITQDLIAQGIPENHIVLAFIPESQPSSLAPVPH
ncbi:MAG: hypothetical protein Fur0025_32240 [Oscillatoriaceae cyanobacterium]